MKKFSKNLKYLVFTFTLIVAGFTFTNSTEAGQYSYSCADGGTVTSNVGISPTGPFSAGATTPFDVFVTSVTSTCTSRAINLTAQNNSGPVITLVNQTFTGAIGPFFYSSFTTPSTAGTYAVHFITGVDEPGQIIQNYTFGVTDKEGGGAITGVCTLGTPYGGDPGYILIRDQDTRQNAEVRGVAHVFVTQEITTDNQNGYCQRILTGDFYPGDLEVPGVFEDRDQPQDFTCGSQTNYCSAVVTEGQWMEVTVQEYF